MPLTLEDIAHLAGVSRSTVSRVINGDVNVREETRLKVLEVIQRLNFQPNLAARSLAAGRTGVIGLVIPAGVSTIFVDPFFPQLIQGVSAAGNANDYSMMLWLAESAYEQRTIRQILHSGLLDGIIVSSMLIDDPIVESLHKSKMPFILIGRHPTLDVNYLDVDNVLGGREATLHLLRLGYQRVATITGPQNMIAGLDRYQGYREALQAYDVPIRSELVVESDFSENGGYAAMKRLLPAKPDAIFIASDTMTMGALRALREVGLRVPQDVAIVGYDDVPAAAKIEPPLTTIRQSTHQMGYTAMETLLDIIRLPNSHLYHIILPTELVVRASCGANGPWSKEVIAQ